MTCLALIEEHLGMGFWTIVQNTISEFCIPEAKRVQVLLNWILKRDFYILGPTEEAGGKNAICQLKLFLSSKRIWLKNVQVFWISNGCSILLSSWFPKKSWWVVPVPEGNQSWIFVAVSLFEANWFVTGNKCFSGQIFRNAQGKTFKVVLNC